MKKLIMVGKSGAGKTTLTQALLGQKIVHKKTQGTEFNEHIIDIPGEYLENPRFYNAIITMAFDADVMVLVSEAGSDDHYFPPNFGSMFNLDVIGVVTKLDLICNEDEIERARFVLSQAGASSIFTVSAVTDEGMDALKKLLEA